MSKTNRFHIKKIEDEVNVTIEEERKDHSPFYLLLKRNQFLIYMIVLMLSLIVSSLTIYVIAKNIDISSVVEYEWKGVVETFEDGNKSVIDGTPIIKEYASKLFDTTLLNTSICAKLSLFSHITGNTLCNRFNNVLVFSISSIYFSYNFL